jgi:hypothetical protein
MGRCGGRWYAGEGGIQGEGGREEARGLGVGGVSVCTSRDRVPSMLRLILDTQCSCLAEDVALDLNVMIAYGVEHQLKNHMSDFV